MKTTHSAAGLERWDYLIVTASNDLQAKAYERQLAARRDRGRLGPVGDALVIADPEGRRVGSGGSTLFCLMTVLNREAARRGADPANWDALEAILRSLRILIVHAGGDSRRLPAYSACGKIFVPVPGSGDPVLGTALFDRELPVFGALPAGKPGAGQVVVTSGDALIRFNPAEVRCVQAGISALGCYATPDHAGKHGVFCADAAGRVRLYLQKPRPAEQSRLGAVNARGQAILDIGVMSLDAATAVTLLRAFDAHPDRLGNLVWSEPMREMILERGLDIYREVCCALGTEATAAHHLASARTSGSSWGDAQLGGIFSALRSVPFFIQVVSECRFLHFGTTGQLISSGLELTELDVGHPPKSGLIALNNDVGAGAAIRGAQSWVEGCCVRADLSLGGNNVVIGVDVEEQLSLPPETCLDVLDGRDRHGQRVCFVRCYGVRDTFKDTGDAATLCGQSLTSWIAAAGVSAEAIWDSRIPVAQRSLWDARVFPAELKHADYRRWLWMYAPETASSLQKKAFLAADRYSVAEMAVLADQAEFYFRRERLRAPSSR